MATDPRKLKPTALTRLLNSTPLGEVINDRQLFVIGSKPAFALGTTSTSICFAMPPG